MNQILDHAFYHRAPETVAADLLGQLLVSTIGGKKTSGIIVETEAYLSSNDSACHASRGQTPSNSSMFSPAGTAYVYPIHAKHCFNVSAESEGLGSAVLIRALQPIENLGRMQQRRNQQSTLQLCSGPGKLCQALGIDRSVDGNDLTHRSTLWIEMTRKPKLKLEVCQTERIGVTSAQELKLRFVIAGSQFASGPKHLR